MRGYEQRFCDPGILTQVPEEVLYDAQDAEGRGLGPQDPLSQPGHEEALVLGRSDLRLGEPPLRADEQCDPRVRIEFLCYFP